MSSKKDESSPKQSFTVRTMEIGDLAEVYSLGEKCFTADLWPTLYRSWDEYEVTTLFNTDGDYCLVAENDADDPLERIVGFVLGTVISKSNSAWSYGYIIWLCAHPKWQREGVASKLVDKLVDMMVEEDGIRIMMADTDPENAPAVKFFSKKGFSDQKPHLYMSTNLEHNEYYSKLIHASREAALDAEYLKKIRKLAENRNIKRLSQQKRKTKTKTKKETKTTQSPKKATKRANASK